MTSEILYNSYKLVIVESPSKCKKIESFLNNGNDNNNTTEYKCIASCGHIQELNGLESIDINNNFTLSFIKSESKKDQISKLGQAIKKASEIILATDDDREGEAIAWHICNVYKLPITTTKRILFHEITESALKKSIRTPTTINMSIVNAQFARQTLDILVGYKLSPLLWKHVKDGISAGRCQTPALRLIYENQKEIDISPGKQCYCVTGYFTNKNIPFILNHEETDEINLCKFLEKSKSYVYKLDELHTKEKQSTRPLAFTTSTLQQACSNKFHISPKETMSICQKLYETGMITYPRTESTTYSEEFKKSASKYIISKYGENYLNNDIFETKDSKDKKPTKTKTKTKTKKKEKGSEDDCPHEAIRPTNIKQDEINESQYTSKESRVYRLIRERTLESCMKDAIMSVLTCSINAPLQHIYKYQTEKVIFAGWKIVAGYDDVNKEYNLLMLIKPTTQLICNKIKAVIHLKETKQHYTEAKLIQLLEDKGIGRPSTFSSLIDKIQERKYVKKESVKGKTIICKEYELENDVIRSMNVEREFGNEKSKLIITPIGIMALEFLLKHFDSFFEYSYTKQMEDDLDEVAKDNIMWQDVCKKCNEEIENLSSAILERGKEMIRIDDEHSYMIGKYGPVIKCTTNKKVSFKAIRKDVTIDLNKLRKGEYTIEDLIETEETKQNKSIAQNDNSIGSYKDIQVYVKTGKFGKYLEWNNVRLSLKHIKTKVENITIDDIAEELYDLENKQDEPPLLREITEDASIRKGKYGDYIYYKNKKMKKPKFLKLDGFKKNLSSHNYLTCDISVLKEWFNKTYIDT